MPAISGFQWRRRIAEYRRSVTALRGSEMPQRARRELAGVLHDHDGALSFSYVGGNRMHHGLKLVEVLLQSVSPRQ